MNIPILLSSNVAICWSNLEQFFFRTQSELQKLTINNNINSMHKTNALWVVSSTIEYTVAPESWNSIIRTNDKITSHPIQWDINVQTMTHQISFGQSIAAITSSVPTNPYCATTFVDTFRLIVWKVFILHVKYCWLYATSIGLNISNYNR